jgi:predicted Kef-type K+ transport protein
MTVADDAANEWSGAIAVGAPFVVPADAAQAAARGMRELTAAVVLGLALWLAAGIAVTYVIIP